MKSYLSQYIDGAWVESEGGTRHEVIDPATEQPCTEITLGTAAEVDKAVAAARRAFETYSQTTVAERLDHADRFTAEAARQRRRVEAGTEIYVDIVEPDSGRADADLARAGIGEVDIAP